QSLIRSRYTFAILSGLILASAFPNVGIAGFAWLAPALILASALGTDGRKSFRIGYVAGFAHYLASLYWLLCIPVRGFPILGWIALSAFLSLFPASWTWLCTKYISRSYPLAEQTDSTSLRAALINWAGQPWFQRFGTALLCAALWVGLEMII